MLPDPACHAIVRQARADRTFPASKSLTVTTDTRIPVVATASPNHANSLKSMALGPSQRANPGEGVHCRLASIWRSRMR